MYAAFLDELHQIAAAAPLSKEAGIKDKFQKLMDLLSGNPIATKVLDPATGQALSIPTKKPFHALKESLMSSGKLMSTPHKMVHQGLPDSPSLLRRMTGGALHGMGEGIDPSLATGLGAPSVLLGGAGKGILGQASKEVATTHPQLSRALDKAKPAAEFVGELAGSMGMGALAGIPVAYAAGKGALTTGALMAGRKWADRRNAVTNAVSNAASKVAAARRRMTVAQSRRGRRPMRVGTLMRKDQEGTLFKQKSAMLLGLGAA